MEHFLAKGTQFSYQKLGKNGPLVLWGHGWGHDHKTMLPLATALEKSGQHILFDFPGFGKSAPPRSTWGTEDYADAIAEWMRANGLGPCIWVGHSFGGRVGIQLAARHSELVKGMFLMAAAGLKRKRPLHRLIYMQGQVWTFKLMRNFVPDHIEEDWIKKRFGSSDYKNAGPMRGTFVKVVNENLKTQAEKITCPVKLVYGSEDNEAPPEIGRRLEKLMKNAEMIQLEGEDHYSILTHGRHQAVHFLEQFIKDLC